MIYQYDQALPMPTKDLYDTQIMQMAVAAAKDMYDRGEKRIDDFYKKYEDFYSPITGATEDVYNTGIGRIRGIINDLYGRGIDPLRSAEGRAIVSQAIRETDIARINARKQEAEMAKQYIKNRDIAIMNGTYDPDVERAVNGGKLLEEWTADDGYWKSTAPIKYMSQDDMISPLAKALNPEFDAVRTAQENNGYDYKTVSEDRIRQMVADNLDDLISKSTMGKYYYDQALKQAGDDPQLARQILAEQYVQAAKKHTKEDREINQYTYYKMQSEERRKAAAEDDARAMKQMEKRLALEYHYKDLENKEAQIQKLNNTGRRSNDGYPNIFDSADRNPNSYVNVKPGYQYENKIDPASRHMLNDGNGNFVIYSKNVKDAIDRGDIVSENGQMFKSDTFSTAGDLFIETSTAVIKDPIYKDKDGKTKKQYGYYIKARLYKAERNEKGEVVKDDKGKSKAVPVNEKSGGTVLIRIKERDANYAEQQKKDRSVDTTN